MTETIKSGNWPDTRYPEQVAAMVASVKSGHCDWSRWGNWVVIAGYDEGKLTEVMITKLYRIEEV